MFYYAKIIPNFIKIMVDLVETQFIFKKNYVNNLNNLNNLREILKKKKKEKYSIVKEESLR